MRDYKAETERRVGFISDVLDAARMNGIVYGNSGGKPPVVYGG